MTVVDDQNIHDDDDDDADEDDDDDDDDAKEDAEDDLNALNDWANGVAEGATSTRVLIHLKDYHHDGHQNEMSPPRFDMLRMLIFPNCAFFLLFRLQNYQLWDKKRIGLIFFWHALNKTVEGVLCSYN